MLPGEHCLGNKFYYIINYMNNLNVFDLGSPNQKMIFSLKGFLTIIIEGSSILHKFFYYILDEIYTFGVSQLN